MKLLHTADWHLGAKLGRHDRRKDHRAALRALLDVATAERPDLIVHAGDLFDAYRPPYPALRLGVTALQRLAQIATTVVIGGNHDSGALLDVLDDMAGMASPRRLRFVTTPRVLEFDDLADVPVALACVPFIPPGAITDYATADALRFEGDYSDGICAFNDRVIGRAREVAGPNGIVLYAAHLHVGGARPGIPSGASPSARTTPRTPEACTAPCTAPSDTSTTRSSSREARAAATQGRSSRSTTVRAARASTPSWSRSATTASGSVNGSCPRGGR